MVSVLDVEGGRWKIALWGCWRERHRTSRRWGGRKMATKPQMDIKAALGRYTLSKFGRKRPIASKRPRDRLVESLGNQIEIVHVMKAGRDPKEAGLKAHRMFFEHQGRYIVQVKYTNTPLELADEADAVEVDKLDDVEEVMKK